MDEAARATQRWDAQSGPPAQPAEPSRSRSLMERGYASLPNLGITRLLTPGPADQVALARESRRGRPIRPGRQSDRHADVFRRLHHPATVGVRRDGRCLPRQAPPLPRRDALKVLTEGTTADPEFRERFSREADLAATLWHPHIVAVHDRGEFDGHLWIAMDYVEGTDAARLMRERFRGGMADDEVCAIVTAVAGALDYAHARGLLHRDVKPANILLTHPDEDDRRILLADFGVARQLADISGITETNVAVGTVAYAAPEQLVGSNIDGRADQYALAASAFHLLTGSPPFQNSNPVAVIGQHLHAAPPRLSDSRPDLADLDDVFFKALAKEPSDRFDRCRQFAAASVSTSPAAGRRSRRQTGRRAQRPRSAHRILEGRAPAVPESRYRLAMVVTTVGGADRDVGDLVLLLGRPPQANPASPPRVSRTSTSGSALAAPPLNGSTGWTTTARSRRPTASSAPTAEPPAGGPFPPRAPRPGAPPPAPNWTTRVIKWPRPAAPAMPAFCISSTATGKPSLARCRCSAAPPTAGRCPPSRRPWCGR